jgi:hypothetical protein
MIIYNKMLVLILLLNCWSCGDSENQHQNALEKANFGNTIVNTDVNVEKKEFILGKWHGKTYYMGNEKQTVITLTFKADGSVTETNEVPNLPRSGEEIVFNYKFVSENIIASSRYPDNLRIIKISDNEIKFAKHPAKSNEVAVDLIYSCRFYRVKK